MARRPRLSLLTWPTPAQPWIDGIQPTVLHGVDMTRFLTRRSAMLICAATSLGMAAAAVAADAKMLEQDARAALQVLYAGSPGAKALGEKSKGMVVFPKVVKAGLVVGGQSGDGVLMVGHKVVGLYNTSAVSMGAQAGAQSFGYGLFFMTDKALADFRDSQNFQVGVGPSVVFIDEGAAKDVNSLTAKADVYGVIFDQKGLMAGVGVQGSKITRLK
jgi:lipid-binding SYLF domain-containing protein